MSSRTTSSSLPQLPLVSVLMPAYNAEKYILQSLPSLLAQTYENWELLIADDGSTDGTRAIIDTFEDSRIRRFHRAGNQGYLKTWNDLLVEAEGQYITFLDADDYISKDRIALLVRFLNENKDVGLCGTGIAFVNDDQVTISERTYPEDWEKIQEVLYTARHFPFCGSAVMIRRQVAKEIGGYRDFFNRVGWEDHDWLMRCCERFKAANLPIIAYYYRKNPFSVSRFLDYSDNSIRKLTIKKIGLELANQRKLSGRDFLMDDNQTGLEAIIKKYEKPYHDDPSRIYRLLSSRALQEGSRKTSRLLAMQGIRRNFFHPSNYLSVLRSLIAPVSV